MPAIPAIPAGGMPGVMPGMAPMCKTQMLKVFKYDEVSKKNAVDVFKKNQPKINKKNTICFVSQEIHGDLGAS